MELATHLTKVNYHIHTDAIKENLIPAKLTKQQVNKEYEQKIAVREFKKLFFVAFHPKKSLEQYVNQRKEVEILFGEKLAEMIFNFGLLKWALNKSF